MGGKSGVITGLNLNKEDPMKKTLYTLFILLGLVGQCFGFMALHGSGVATSLWDFECYFEGTVSTTTYTAGGDDSGFSSATLSEVGLVSEANNNMVIDAAGENVNVAITAKDIFDSENGAIEIRFKCATTVGTNTIFEVFITSANQVKVYVSSGNDVKFWHEGNNIKKEVISGTEIVDDTISRVQVKWYVTGVDATSILAVRVDDDDDGTYDSWQEVATPGDLTDLTTDPTVIGLGSINYATTDVTTIYSVKLSTDHTVFD